MYSEYASKYIDVNSIRKRGKERKKEERNEGKVTKMYVERRD